MSNHFPTIPSYAVSGVIYYVLMLNENIYVPITGIGASAVFGNNGSIPIVVPVSNAIPIGETLVGPFFNWSAQFDTNTQDESGNEVYNYTGFDQDAVESTLVTFVNSVMSAIATAAGISETDLGVTPYLFRQWLFTAQSGNSSSESYPVFYSTTGDWEEVSLS